MSSTEISPAEFRIHMMDILQDMQRFCEEKGKELERD